MDKYPSLALDLPLKALAWESAEGKAWLSYNSPEENTPIRPGGQVEFVGAELRKAARPDRADDRAFYMNVLMNGLTKEGYRFVGMTSDEILMERPVR